MSGEHYVSVGGEVRLFVRELGDRGRDRPSLLVLHGGPDVGHSYRLPGVERLAADHHVVLFDFRGCGRSSCGLAVEELQPELVVQTRIGSSQPFPLDRSTCSDSRPGDGLQPRSWSAILRMSGG
ncbi:alpha/beta fold hydrolase [Microlunatus soli]|uniref:AB hydrolase-1 domain-containing protein n=1 Tax=Microlunatus soli TaxID=630515 RepID=A0A1H1QWC6_9ACTN|nr:hypothetical protein SAMN04489812_1414 [Microlunatus soli]